MDSNTTLFLISTGITFIYFLLKVCRYIFYAISHKTEGRLAAATPGCGKQKYCPDPRKEGHKEVYEQIPGDNTEQYGSGTQRSSGPLPVPRRRKDIRFSSCGDVTEYSEKSSFRQNEKDCQAEGIEIPKTIMAKNPVAHMMTPQEYLQKVVDGVMPQMDNHQTMKELAEKNDQTKFLMMEFRDIERPQPPTTPQVPKHK